MTMGNYGIDVVKVSQGHGGGGGGGVLGGN